MYDSKQVYYRANHRISDDEKWHDTKSSTGKYYSNNWSVKPYQWILKLVGKRRETVYQYSFKASPPKYILIFKRGKSKELS